MGHLHRDRGRQPARRQPGRDHQRDPRQPTTARHTALLADPPTDASAKPDADLRRRRLGLADAAAQPAARRVDARAGRTPRGRPPRRHGLGRRRGTPRSTSPRASATSLAKRVGAPAGHHRRCSRWRAARRSRSRSTTPAAASGWPTPPADPTVRLRMSREAFIRLAGGRCDAEPGTIDGRGRPGPRRSRSSTRWRPPRDAQRARPGRSPTSPTRPAARSWSPAPPWAGSATTPRSSWPAAAPGWCWPAAAASGSTRPSRPIRAEVPAAALETVAARPGRPVVGTRGPRPRPPGSGRSTCWSTTPGVMGTPYHAHRRRARAADGDQPLRAVPADRAAAAAAGGERCRARWSRCPRRCTGSRARRRSTTRTRSRAATSAGRSYGADQAREPALHLRAGPAARGGPSCRSRRWPRTRASPRPTWPPTASTAGRPAASPRSSTPRSRPSRRTAPTRAPGRR